MTPEKSAPTDQRVVIAALRDGAVAGLEMPQSPPIETHCSLIFLTIDRAFKLKKAVSFSYLDYSSLAARERCIRAELELNRRTAPQLYLRCHKIVRHDDKLALAPPEDAAPALDWLLEMRRFPDDALLADRAAAHRLTPDQMRDLADAVHQFHQRALQRRDHGSAVETGRVLRECIDNLRLHAPPLNRQAIERLAQGLAAQLAAQAALIDRRREAGFVRHCHGDLHLGNICLIDDRPVLFDCIDFSEMIACIDVAYDLAFLLMDLCQRGRTDADCLGFANLLLNRWLDRSGDAAALALLPFFQALRAAIRAHILATSARLEEANDYLAAAAAHLQPGTPRMIAIGGLSGSGKSTLARAVAPDFQPLPGARIIRSDSLRKRLAGVAPETRLPAASYSQESSDRVYAAMLAEARQVIAAGYTVILDAAFLREDERQAVAALAGDLRVPSMGVWLDVPAPILAARIAQRRHDASDADAAVLSRQLTRDLGLLTWHRLVAGNDLAADIAALRALITSGGAG